MDSVPSKEDDITKKSHTGIIQQWMTVVPAKINQDGREKQMKLDASLSSFKSDVSSLKSFKTDD